MMVTGIEARVCEDIAARQQLGINKYGTTVEGNPLPLRDWLQHAYEEALDMAIYLRRAIEEPQECIDIADYKVLHRKYIDVCFDAELLKMKAKEKS
jgi:hypothetical protein